MSQSIVLSIVSWPDTIADAGAKLRDGTLTSSALTRHCLDGIEALQPQLNAFITVTEDMALETAAAMDAELASGNDHGPLHGIPIVIKDDTNVAGYPATAGSAIYRDRIPEEDATVIKRLKEAGAVILGKANMNEFAAGGRGGFNPHYGDTRNPWSLDHEPGGSSSGTGASVAGTLMLGRYRNRCRRFGPGPGRTLWRCWNQTHLRPGQQSRHLPALLEFRSHWAVGSDRCGCNDYAQRHGRV